MTASALDLILKMIEINPKKRISASQALQHPYFTSEEPSMTPSSEMPCFEGELNQLAAKKAFQV